jgi:hypothetical protein
MLLRQALHQIPINLHQSDDCRAQSLSDLSHGEDGWFAFQQFVHTNDDLPHEIADLLADEGRVASVRLSSRPTHEILWIPVNPLTRRTPDFVYPLRKTGSQLISVMAAFGRDSVTRYAVLTRQSGDMPARVSSPTGEFRAGQEFRQFRHIPE